jgi:hypothetical protein
MIRKHYKPDGSPDLRAWLVECDICAATHELSDTRDWLIPAFAEMPDYCPVCTAIIAACLIERAFT